MSRGCLCINTVLPGLDGGSNQARRSVGKVVAYAYVGDQIATGMGFASQAQTKLIAHFRARAIGGDDLSCAQGIGAKRRLDSERDLIRLQAQADHTRLPAQVHRRTRCDAF